MSDSIPKGAIPIGSKLYLFKSKSNSTDCLISAHGGYYKESRTFQVPNGVTLYFYGEHKKVLSDPGIKLADTKAKYVERVGEGQKCVNYILSKYQGKHNKAGETYEKIADRIAFQDKSLGDIFKMITTTQNEKLATKGLGMILDSQSMSVVTIRNRWFASDVNLLEVISAVRKVLPGIKNFHCSFCRSLVGDPNPETSTVVFA
jgi:hypothetical protein